MGEYEYIWIGENKLVMRLLNAVYVIPADDFFRSDYNIMIKASDGQITIKLGKYGACTSQHAQ